MNRTVRKVLTTSGLLIGVLVVTLVIIAAFFQNAVGKQLISYLNRELKTEMKVGNFRLSLLKNFPNATVTLEDVIVMGLNKQELLEADEVAFNFRLLSLFGKQVQFHTVNIRNGSLNVMVDKAGRPNYDIFKESESAETGQFNVSLEQATLENMDLLYRDEKLKQEMVSRVDKAEFSGQFSDEKYDLKSTASLTSSFVDLDGVRYFADKKWGYDAVISVDVPRGRYTFEDVKVNVEDNVFKVKGSLQSQKTYTDFDLAATAADASLESVIALLPQQMLETFGDFASTGKFRFGAAVKGKLSAAERPAILFSFGLTDGKVSSPRLSEPFKDVSFTAEYSNGEGRNAANSVFHIKDFKGYLNRQLITLTLEVDNLENPSVHFEADGAVPVADVYGLFNNPAITGGDGEVEFKNLRVDGLYSDMKNVNRIPNVRMSGEINFDDVSLTVHEEKLVADRGILRFQDNLMTLEDVKIDGAGSEILLRGTARNLLPVLLADSLNSENAVLDFSAELTAATLDAGRLVKLTEVPVQEGEVQAAVFDSMQVANNQQKRRITDFLKGTFTAKIEAFKYEKIEGKNFNGQLTFENSHMRIEGAARGMQGAFKVDGTLFFEKAPRLDAKVDCENIDVNAFFDQTNNAGQTVLTADNISGTMNSKMLIHAFWDSTGQFLMDKMHVWAGIGIKEGELKNFKMLEEFSTYAKMDDLRNVQFVDLQNWLEIKDGIFYLPAMFIQNNAMNLTVGGQQSFDDKIDYGIKVNAGQVLVNKFKKKNNKLDPIPANKNGFFNLYFNVLGTLDDYKYETNKRKVKDQFERSEKQKQQIRAALILAFGAPLNMLREPEGWKDEGEKTPVAQDKGDEYIPGF